MTIALAARRMRAIVLFCLTGLSMTGPTFAQSSNDKVHVDIPAQSLSSALTQFGRDTGTEIVFTPEAVNQKTSTAIKGDFAREKAISLLLAGTGLTYRITAQGAIVINATPVPKSSSEGPARNDQAARLAQSNVGSQSQSNTEGPQYTDALSSQSEPGKDKLSEIVVTGTHIRGASAESEPLTIYDRTAIENTGSVTVSDFAATMTENFNSVTSFNGSIGLPVPGPNQSGGALAGESGFNIHGLGPEATLTLLNGVRITGAGGFGSFVDASIIPTAAVKQIEVLTDGASAIYGSDAVAGVVNIILRDDFTGAESSVRYGAPTRGGGADEMTASQLLGDSWGSGHAMLVYQYDKQGSLNADDRSFIPAVTQGRTLIIPYVETNSAILTLNQALGESTSISLDALYGGHQFRDSLYGFFQTDQFSESNEYAANLALNHNFASDWQGRLVGSYSKALQDYSEAAFATLFPTIKYGTSSSSIHADANGSVAALPGGELKVAFGGDYRRDTLSQSGFASIGVAPTLSREIGSLFAEILIPLIGDGNKIPGGERLQLSIAGRDDHYSDFGNTINPHVGLLWSPLRGLSMRGTYARSFRAPRLDELSSSVPQDAATYVVNPASPTGQSGIILEEPFGNPSLRAETSRTYSFGADVRPPEMEQLHVSATYFHTLFEGLIADPPCPAADCYFAPYNAPFLNTSPSQALIQQLFQTPGFSSGGLTPSDITAVFNYGYTNLSKYTQSGLDLSASYAFPIGTTSLTFAESASYLIENEFLTVSGLPEIGVLNGVGEPLKFRARSSVGWKAGGFSSLVTADYRNAYTNEFQVPPQAVSPWTTVDVHLAYEFNKPGSWLTRGVRMTLNVANIFDRNPPGVDLPGTASSINLGYDPVNGNPLGRVVSVSIDKKW